MSRPTVMVDTNIVFSGVIFDGPEARLLGMAQSGAFTLLIPDYVVAEARAVVSRKMPAFLDVLGEFMDQGFLVRVPPPPPDLIFVAERMIRDRKDCIVLASAMDANPFCLVTGDKDFHTEVIRAKVMVVTANQAISLLSGMGLWESSH